jgi:hypothetical protein
MPIRARKSFRIGPPRFCVRFTFTQRGFSSWGIRVGFWSWNARTRQHSVDLPGPLRWQSAPKRGRRSR